MSAAPHDGRSAPAGPEEPDGPVVGVRAGLVRGIVHPGRAAFLGIPYAAAPVGPLRFAAPHPVRAWEGVRPVVRYGPTPQRRPFADATTIPEPSIPGDDTLTVNVFTPAVGDSAARLPVFVWIHGGGFFAGSPASPWYDGRSFARDGVVVVTLGYRLGFDGFGWIDGAPPNRGLLDQIAALEWVQENIHAFGGDPARVTIGGQSAGGASVLALLTSPRARGLFAGAISQSGPPTGVHAADAVAVGRRMAEAVGVRPDLAGWRSVPEATVLDHERAFLRLPGAPGLDTSVVELLRLMRDTAAQKLGLAFSPVVDGDTVAADPLAELRTGPGARIPLLLGTTRDEFAFPTPTPPAEIAAALRQGGVVPVAVDAFLRDVAETGDEHAGSRPLAMQSFRVPTVHVADARRTSAARSTWLYDFRWRSPESHTAGHCLDIPFAWDLLDAAGVAAQLGPEPPRKLAERMHADWVAFVTEHMVPWRPIGEDLTGAFGYAGECRYDPDAYAVERAIVTSSAPVG